MDFFETVRNRRSIRKLTAEPVPEADLMAMLETARIAPSTKHSQPWQFIVIRDPGLLNQLKDTVNAVIDCQTNNTEDEEIKTELEGWRFNATFVFDAPVVITALTRPFPSPIPEEQRIHNPGLQSVAAAITQLHLAATAMGYGGCWTTFPVEIAQPEIEAILEIGKPWFPAAFLSIGIPVKTPREITRKSIEEIVTFR